MDALVIAGPTASGKTALALALAQQVPSEIINMDSALVYRGMNIGTAKPTVTEMQQVPHHLIDIIEPHETYSAADFVRDVEALIPAIKARGKLPIVVGGTMMYLHGWLVGLSDLPSADEALRAQLQQAWQENADALRERLLQLDPVTGARLHPNDQQRILRALEVISLTGKPLSEQQQQRHATQLDLTLVFMQSPSRHWLHERISQRFDAMLDQGFLTEVKALMQDERLHPDLPSMRSVGYRQAWQYLQGELDLTQLKEQGKAATRSLAKRQETWMKKLVPQLVVAADLPLDEQLKLLTSFLSLS